jgi:hypothetical protein
MGNLYLLGEGIAKYDTGVPAAVLGINPEGLERMIMETPSRLRTPGEKNIPLEAGPVCPVVCGVACSKDSGSRGLIVTAVTYIF